MPPTPDNVTALATAPQDWSPEHLALIRNTICHPSMSPLEIALFLEQCRRTQLDPLRGEAFCVPRRTKITVSGREEWVDRYTFQPAEAGMSSRGAKFPDYRGIRSAAFFEEDKMIVTEIVDPTNGSENVARIEHSYSPNKPRGRLVGAWALVDRDGFRFSPEIVYRQEYEQRNGKGEITKAWQKPHTMIVKCARSAAWRRAFPEAFSGMYSREEVELERDAEEQAPPAAATAAPGPRESKGDAVKARIEGKLKELHAPAVVTVVAGKVEAPAAQAPTKAEVKAALGTITNSDMDRAGPPPVDSEFVQLARALDEAEKKKGAKLTREEEDKLRAEFKSPPPASPSPSAGATAASDNPGDIKLTFGPKQFRGHKLGSLTSDTLIGLCALAEEELAKGKGDEPWYAGVKRGLDAAEKLLGQRDLEQGGEEPPDSGEDVE